MDNISPQHDLAAAAASVAIFLKSRHLEAPAQLLLAAHVPIASSLIHSGMLVLQPILRFLVGSSECQMILQLLESEDGLSLLLTELETGEKAE